MSVDKCILGVREKLKNLSKSEMDALIEDIDKIKEKADASGKDVRNVIQEVSSQYRRAIEMAKSQKLMSAASYKKNSEFLAQPAFKKDPVAGMKALIQADLVKNYKGNANIYRRKNTIVSHAEAMIEQTLEKQPALRKLLEDGDINTEKALYRFLHDGDTKGMSPQLIEVAKAFKKVNNHIYERKRSVGFGTRKLDTFVAPNKHSTKAMEVLGIKKWKTLARNTFNFERMQIHPDKIDEYLDRFWTKRMNSRGVSFFKVSDNFEDLLINGASERMGKRRSVHFNDGDAAFMYNSQMGGKSVYERIIDGISKDSGTIAAAEVLGPNFKATWSRLMTDTQKAAATAGKPMSSTDTVKLNNFFKYAVEGDHQPEMNMVAKTGDFVRKFTDVTKLGNALPTTLSDIGFASQLFSGSTGDNILSTQLKVINEFWKQMRPMGKDFQRKVGSMLGVFMDTMNGDALSTRYGDLGDGEAFKNRGWFNNKHSQFMRLTGLPRQAQAMKMAISKMFATKLYEESGKRFDNLFHGLQTGLSRFGIDGDRWNILRQAADDFGDGTKGLTIEKIHDLDDLAFEKLPEIIETRENFVKNNRILSQQKGKPLTKAQKASVESAEKAFQARKKLKIEALKNDLASGYSNYLSEVAEVGSPVPGVDINFWKSQIPDRNDWLGQIIRFGLQYKSFTLGQFKTMKAIHNLGTTRTAKMQRTAATIVNTMMWGYAAMAIKDLSKGREVRDPFSFETFGDAFLQSGAGLIYSDFLLAEYQKPFISLPGQLAGPAVTGGLQDLSILLAKGKEEVKRQLGLADKGTKQQLKGGQILSVLERNTPNIFFTKAVLNKNIYDAIHKALNVKQRRSKKYKNRFEYDLHKKFKDLTN